MIKSGLIAGGVMFLLALSASAVIRSLCALYVPVLIGLGERYLTGVFNKPGTSPEAMRKGAIAAGTAILGQRIAAVFNAFIIFLQFRSINVERSY